MKFVIVVLFLFPFKLLAQHFYEPQTPPPSGARLFQLQHHTVLIRPMDLSNQAQVWTTLDSTLLPVTTKKLVTPGSENLISQSYIEAPENVIRVDQFIIDDELRISAFVFDVYGNIIRSKEIEASEAQGGSLAASPMFISQSPDKEFLALSQQMINGEDSLSIVYFLINLQLETLQSAKQQVAYDPVTTDVYLPVVSNAGSVYFVLADKYNSYRLGTNVTCLSSDGHHIQTFYFGLERKKVKNMQISVSGENMFIAGLFKNEKETTNLSGIIRFAYNLKKKEVIPLVEQSFDDELQKELRQHFSNGRRSRKLFEYLALLPIDSSNRHMFAHMMPEQQDGKIPLADKKTASPPSLTSIQQNIAYVRSFVGTQPPGYNRPMNVAEASAYAALKQMNSTSRTNSSEQDVTRPREVKQANHDNGLLLFVDFGKQPIHKLVRLKAVPQPGFEFFTYYPHGNGYSAIHYKTSGFEYPALVTTTLNQNGDVQEKTLLKERSKLLLPEYDFVVSKGHLIAFYENKKTQTIGIVRLKL